MELLLDGIAIVSIFLFVAVAIPLVMGCMVSEIYDLDWGLSWFEIYKIGVKTTIKTVVLVLAAIAVCHLLIWSSNRIF